MDGRLDDEQHNYLRQIQGSGEMLLSLINNILDFSKMELGTLSLDATPFNLAELVSDASSMMLGLAKEKGLALKLQMDESLPGRLVGDPNRISQVLINLVDNAIKFTDQGQVDIKVTPGRRLTDKAVVHLSVTDTGPGIPPLMQERIFERFTQVDSSSTRHHYGTGLGLAICRQLVEQMGGHIGVNSQPGQHTTFWFTLRLPIAEPTDEVLQPSSDMPSQRERREPVPGKAVASRNILVVDEQTAREALGQAAQKLPIGTSLVSREAISGGQAT